MNDRGEVTEAASPGTGGSGSNRATRPSALVAPLVLVAAASGAYLLWQLRVELVVLFAALLFGVSLHAAANWASRRTGLGHRASVGVISVATFALFSGLILLGHQRLTNQYGEFGERLPRALKAAETRLSGVPVIGSLSGQLAEMRESLTEGGSSSSSSGSSSSQGSGSEGRDEEETSQSMQIVQITATTVGRIGLVVILALYIALEGRRYARSLLMLFPRSHRSVCAEWVRGLGRALPRWLLARIGSMAAVTLLTAPGLMLLGIPLALVLALIAGLFSFVPVLGPIAAVVPALLITLEAESGKLLYVLLLYAAVQLAESWLLTPRIQEQMADVPPLLLLSAQLVAGVLVGTVGVMFSTPLALAILVTLQVFYVQSAVGYPVDTPGSEVDSRPWSSRP